MVSDPQAEPRGIIEKAISDLVAMGMERQAAVRMLAFQYVLRLGLADDVKGLMELRQEINDELAGQREDAGGLQ